MNSINSKLLLGNISTDADEERILVIFERTPGKVRSVSIPRDPKTGKNRGYALIEMKTDIEAEQAVKDLDGKEIEGRSMALTLMENARGKRKWYKLGAR